MTPAAVAGGVTRNAQADVEFAHAPGDEHYVTLKYRESEPPGDSYSVAFEPSRLNGVVQATERGWVAIASEVGALGYGESVPEAVEDLLDAIEQYLEFLREERPELAPEVANHADYVSLLGTPRGLWLASVKVNATPVE